MINIPDSAVVSAWRCPGAPSPSAWRCWKQKGCQVLIEKMERTQRCGILWVEYVGFSPKLGWCFPQEKMGLGWFGCILYYYYILLLWYFGLCHYLLISYCDIILDTILQYYVRVIYHNIYIYYAIIYVYIYIVVFKILSYNPVPFGQSHMHLYRLAAGKKSLPSWV